MRRFQFWRLFPLHIQHWSSRSSVRKKLPKIDRCCHRDTIDGLSRFYDPPKLTRSRLVISQSWNPTSRFVVIKIQSLSSIHSARKWPRFNWRWWRNQPLFCLEKPHDFLGFSIGHEIHFNLMWLPLFLLIRIELGQFIYFSIFSNMRKIWRNVRILIKIPSQSFLSKIQWKMNSFHPFNNGHKNVVKSISCSYFPCFSCFYALQNNGKND